MKSLCSIVRQAHHSPSAQPMWFLSLSKEKNQYGQYLLKVIDELKREVNSTNILGKTGR